MSGHFMAWILSGLGVDGGLVPRSGSGHEEDEDGGGGGELNDQEEEEDHIGTIWNGQE